MHPNSYAELAGLFSGAMLLAALYGVLLMFVVYPLFALLTVINVARIAGELRTIAEQLSLPSRRP